MNLSIQDGKRADDLRAALVIAMSLIDQLVDFPNSLIARLLLGVRGLCLTCMPPRLSCMPAKACAGRYPGNTSTRVVQRQRLDMHPSIEE
ncbi:hypothetical protein ACVWZ6_003321 [Bradyrhizobium sp. GM6.1]